MDAQALQTKDKQCQDRSSQGAAGKQLADNICKEEGVVLYACNDDDGVCYLMYIPGYPWEFNHVDLSLTEDKLKTLFQKYVALLSDDPINIGYQRCEKCS